MRVRELVKELERFGPEKVVIVSCKGKCYSPQHVQIMNDEIEISCGWAERERGKEKSSH